MNPLHPKIRLIVIGADKENLFNNQELLKYLVIISFNLVNLLCFGGDNVRRNKMLLTRGGGGVQSRVKQLVCQFGS